MSVCVVWTFFAWMLGFHGEERAVKRRQRRIAQKRLGSPYSASSALKDKSGHSPESNSAQFKLESVRTREQ